MTDTPPIPADSSAARAGAAANVHSTPAALGVSSTPDRQLLQEIQVSLAMAARLIQIEPDAQWLAQAQDQTLFDEAPFGEDNAFVQTGLAQMREYLSDLTPETLEEAEGDLKREWLRLFVGLGTPQAPVWESFYTQANSPIFSQATLEVRAVYRSYGLALDKQGSEPDDSLGIMLGFLSHVAGLAAQHPEPKAHLEVMDGFLTGHILPWLPAWHYEMGKHASTGYFQGVGNLVFGTMCALAEAFGISYHDKERRFVRRRG